jgi:hypothetical protein
MLDEGKQKSAELVNRGGLNRILPRRQDGIGSSRKSRVYLSKGVYSKNFILGALWTHKRVDLSVHARRIPQTNSKSVGILGQIRKQTA